MSKDEAIRMIHEELARAIHADRVRETERALRVRSLRVELAEAVEAERRAATAVGQPKARPVTTATTARPTRKADGTSVRPASAEP